MSRDSSEEQLLFGVLAVQLGFASPAQVMAAGAAWMADREQGLGDRLEATGAVTARQREMIAGMLGEAVRANQGSVHETLGALGGEAVVNQTFAGSLVLEASGEVRPAAEAATTQPDGAGPQDSLIMAPDSPERYQFRGEHGRGGQARVLVALDRNVGREIAWKELHGDRATGSSAGNASRTSAAVTRFLREARITGQLEHPNIVPVHELGTNDRGEPYYTMRLVRGDTLGAKLRACEGLDERMKLLGAVWETCNGIAFAHSRGVIHRDIKPDNVVLGEFGETVILDWGLAKAHGREDEFADELEQRTELLRQAADSSQTLDGAALGTPSYMSPEQAEGAIDQIDERSDVWGLGAMLYELLTGQPPFTGETPFEIVGKVMKDPVRPVAELCQDAPAELAAVAEKALRKDKAERYTSALEITEEINAYMTGRRVGAYAYSSWELLKRFTRRNKALVIAAAVFLVVLLAALVAVWSALQQESAARLREQAALADVRHGRLLANFHLAQSHAREAGRRAENGRVLTARIYAAASLMANPANPRAELYDSDFAASNPAAQRLWVRAASLAASQARGLDAEVIAAHDFSEQIADIALSPPPYRIYAVGEHGTLASWAIAGGAPVQVIKAHDGRISALYLDPEGKVLVTGGRDGKVRFWDPESLKAIRGFSAPARVRYLTLSADGSRLALSASDKAVYLMAADSGRVLRKWTGFADEPREVALSPDGRFVAVACWDKTVHLFSTAGGGAKLLGGHAQAVERVAFADGGRRLVSAGYDGPIRVWDPARGQLVSELAGDPDITHGLAAFPGEPLLVSGGQDRAVKIWDLRSGDLLLALDGADGLVSATIVSPDTRVLAAVFEPGFVVAWRLLRRDGRRQVINPDWMYGLDIGGPAGVIATGSWDGRLRLLDRTSLATLAEARAAGPVMAVTLDRAATRVVAGLRSGEVLIWYPPSGQAAGRLVSLGREHARDVVALAFGPAEKTLYTASHDGTLRTWDLDTRTSRPLLRLDGKLGGVVFCGDGRLLVGGPGGILKQLDPGSGRITGNLEGHAALVTDLACAPDQSVAASCDQAGQVIVWNLETGRPRAQLKLSQQYECFLAFSPDGQLIAVGQDDGELNVWDWRRDRLVAMHDVGDKVERLRFDTAGRRVLVIHKQALTALPIDTGALDADPSALLEAAQRKAGLRLDGIDLTFVGPRSPAP